VYLRNNPSGQPTLAHLTKKHGKGKAVIVLAYQWPHQDKKAEKIGSQESCAS
jgi:hypothetical protein